MNFLGNLVTARLSTISVLHLNPPTYLVILR